jgi:hypothetical protein
MEIIKILCSDPAVRKKWAIATIFLGLFILSAVIGCSRNVLGGNPALPLASSNGTVHVFALPEGSVTDAITNAFMTGYRGMILRPAAEEAYLVANWQPSNGYVLFPLTGPIGTVPLQGHTNVVAPYTAYFYITTLPTSSSNTKVLVRTLLADVTDGKEIGVHGGWANHRRPVPPVQVEEDNVLEALSNYLASPKTNH